MESILRRLAGSAIILDITKTSSNNCLFSFQWCNILVSRAQQGALLGVSLIAPAGFWPKGQNPRRHPRIPRVYTYKEFQKSKKCVGSMRSVLDLMKLGAHGGLA